MITLTSNLNTAFNTTKGLTWIVKLTLDDATRYWASEIVTISSQEYVGRFIVDVAEIDQSVDISIGGGLASVGNASLELNEIVTQNGLHRDFKPQSAGTELLNRTAEIGCIYNFGSLSTTDIVWLYKGVIDDYNLAIEGIGLDVVGAREVETLDLPRELVNKTDYANAPKESIGLPLPILYGDFQTGNYDGSVTVGIINEIYTVCPTVCVDKSNVKFIAAGHVCKSVAEGQYYKTDSMKSAAILFVESSVGTYTSLERDEDNAGYSTIVIPKGTIIANCFGLFSRAGRENTVTTFQNTIDGDTSTTATVSQAGMQYLALHLEGLPDGKTVNNLIMYVNTSGAYLFRIGTIPDGSTMAGYVNISTPTGVGSAFVSADFATTGLTANDILRKQFVVNCDVVLHTVTLDTFGFGVGVIIDETYLPTPKGSIGRTR